jgi:4-carboxymuconolactone decarboxylase
MDRMPPLAPADLTPAQAEAARVFAQERGAEVFGPFVPLIRSPELMLHLQRVGAHCRYRSAVGLKLTELVILIIARRLGQGVEWAIHAPIAARAGLAEETIAAIAQGRRPPALPDDEALVLDAIEELLAHRGWSDATYAAVRARFGEAGVIDLVATAGYYATIGLVMNVARTVAPEGPVLPALPG